jgi:hypothetical protein
MGRLRTSRVSLARTATDFLGLAGDQLNDLLRRAMFAAQFTEGDLAAHLAVDPKTVRRWLDGRMPYPKHRGGISHLLGVDEADLWPELRALRAARLRPADLAAVYPRRSLIPQDSWLSTFATAEQEINILAYSASFLIENSRFRQILADQAARGLRIAVALGDSTRLDLGRSCSGAGDREVLSEHIDEAIERLRPLAAAGQLELRLHDAVLYNSIYRADSHILVSQHLYGIPAADAPVYHLQKTEQGDLVRTYLSSFDRIWQRAKLLKTS